MNAGNYKSLKKHSGKCAAEYACSPGSVRKRGNFIYKRYPSYYFAKTEHTSGCTAHNYVKSIQSETAEQKPGPALSALTASNINEISDDRFIEEQNPYLEIHDDNTEERHLIAVAETDKISKTLPEVFLNTLNDTFMTRFNDIPPQATHNEKKCDAVIPESNVEHGLLAFRKWWEYCESEFYINGGCVSGIPIFIEHNTLRVVDKESSYFIPIEKIDYIRTPDGLGSIP